MSALLTTSDVMAGKILVQLGWAPPDECREHLRSIDAGQGQGDLINRLTAAGRLDDARIQFVRHRVALYEHVRHEAVYVRLLERGTTIKKETVAKLLAQLERAAFRRRLGDVLVRRGNLKPDYDRQMVEKQSRLVVSDNKRILDRYRKQDFAGVAKPLIPGSSLEPEDFKISTLFRSKQTRVLVDKAELQLLRAEALAAAQQDQDSTVIMGPPNGEPNPGEETADPALIETTKLAPGEAAGLAALEAIPDAIPDPRTSPPAAATTNNQTGEIDTFDVSSEEADPLPAGPDGDHQLTIEEVKNLQRIDDYTVVETLGVGGMGAVFLGQKDGAGEYVAIKVLLNQAATDEEKGRFNREVTLCQRVKNDNVIPIIDTGVTSHGLTYMVVPALAGKELRDIMDMGDGVMAPQLARRIMERVLDGMAAVHEAGIVHRDMKPENVFVLAGGMHEIKIMDFGLAKPPDERTDIDVFRTAVIEVAGSPQYIAPESVSCDPIDGRTDVYSLGVMFFEMLTGKLPLESETSQGFLTQHLICPPDTLKDAAPHMEWPQELEDLLERMMAKPRDERPESCRVILAEIEGGLGDKIDNVKPVPTEEEPDPPPPPPIAEVEEQWGFKGLLGRLWGKG